MKKYLSTFLAFIMILSTMLAMPAFGAEAENSTELQFNKDGKFKILILDVIKFVDAAYDISYNCSQHNSVLLSRYVINNNAVFYVTIIT